VDNIDAVTLAALEVRKERLRLLRERIDLLKERAVTTAHVINLAAEHRILKADLERDVEAFKQRTRPTQA
jgi:hypothetical protein